MIKVENLTKRYGDKIVVNNTSWCAADGTITGFIGHNGAGKTTTLKMITGVLKPDDGRIEINNIDIAGDTVHAKEQFGYVSDSPDNFLRLKAIEYLNFIGDVYGISREERNKFISEYAPRFGLQDELNNTILSYSHGMRQKIMVLGALIHNPSVWILDEPMTGLDPQSIFELKKMMKEHAAAGKTVLFSTHVLDVAEKLCDHIVIIKKGVIMYQGTLEDLRKSYADNISLEDIFLEINGVKE